jgi:hypothetical protein
LDTSGGHESAYPSPATAWWGVTLFSLGANGTLACGFAHPCDGLLGARMLS